jgi:hypothetical protein
MDQQMSEIEIYEKRLKEARAREAETFAVAVAALREAIRAKRQVLYEWTELAKARGSTDDFKKTHQEMTWLTARAYRACEKCVRQAIQPSLFSRFWDSESATINLTHYPKRQGVAPGVAMRSRVLAK